MRNNERWTEPRFSNWIRSILRKASQRWPPIYETRSEAKVGRGTYLCAGYKRKAHTVKGTVNKRVNIFVDHILPVGKADDWNAFIDNLFCDSSNLQVLCRECHDEKTKTERKNDR